MPAHNEEAYVAGVVGAIPDFVDFVVVVDDASTDNTAAMAMSVGELRVDVIRHERNEGVGGAILSGHDKAFGLGAEISVVMAGDGQMDPQHLPKLLDSITEEGYDFAKGNRFLTRGTLHEMPRKRILGNAILTFMTKFASGYWHIFDPQNGYTAITREALEAISPVRLKRNYLFENSMLCELNMHNFRVKDVAIPAVYRGQKSGIKAARFAIGASAYLFRKFWRRIFLKYLLRDFHPIALFYLLGTAFALWGVAFGAIVAYWSIGPATASTATVMASIVPFFIGFQLVLTATIMDVWTTPR